MWAVRAAVLEGSGGGLSSWWCGESGGSVASVQSPDGAAASPYVTLQRSSGSSFVNEKNSVNVAESLLCSWYLPHIVSDSQKKPGEFFTLRTEKRGLRVGKRPPELVRVITGCSPRPPDPNLCWQLEHEEPG